MGVSSNAMGRQTFSLPGLLRQQYEDLEPKTRKVLTTPEIFSVQRIVLTGCGDSHAAAMATKPIFEMLTGLPVEVVPALDLARYYPKKQLGFAPNNPLVIAVSNSGGIARVGEAIQRVVKHGGFALGVTGNADSLLGRSVSRILPLEVPAFESAPGTRSYLVSVLALLLLAVRMGEVRGRFTMDEAMAYRLDILAQADALERLLPGMDAQMRALAERWKNLEAYDFISGGRDYAAAWFGHAKVFEAIGRYAMCVNAEEWLHLNFFLRPVDKIGTVMVCCGDNPGLSRMRECLGHAARDMGRPTLLITDTQDALDASGAEVVLTPKTQVAFNSVLTQFAPLCLLMGYLGELLGEVDGRGCVGAWSFAQGGAGIKDSEIIVR